MAQVIHGEFGSGEVETAGVPVAALRTYPVATLNLGPEPGNVVGNLLLAKKAIAEAKEAHPGLGWVVLPELFTSGYSNLASAHCYAEDAERGASVRFFASLARDLGLHIAYGFPERVPGYADGVFDSANLVGPDGLVLTYRKRHLVRTTLEHDVFVPGVELPVVEAGGMRVAIVICWDLGFPEVAREAALAGAEMILAPAAWRAPWGPQYDLSCAARALDNGVYLASANQLGVYPDARFDALGHLYGPDGLRISRSEGERSVGEVDPGSPARWRRLYGNTFLDGVEVLDVAVEPATQGVESVPLEACS